MNRARGRRGTRRARLEQRRQQRNQRYGRFLGFTALGSLLPGAGLVAAGRRRIGGFLLFMLGMAAAGALAVVVLVPSSRLLSYGGDRQMMLLLGGGLAVAAVVWLIVALTTHKLLEPRGLPAGKRLGGVAVVVLATSLVVAPLSIGAKNAFTQREVIGALSGGVSHTTPEIQNAKDPWADIPRLNVLLLGGDAGEGRDGLRPDTLIVASIDTATGDATTISLPRNLMQFPFPEASPLSDLYPDGWIGPAGSDNLEWMLNATWRNIPNAHPEAFQGSDNPHADATKWAVEGALGIEIDYFMLADLQGFSAIVNALGGITVDVPRDIPIGNKSLPGGGCTTPRGYIEEGTNQHLNGDEALWFARSRCGSDDYERMARQQCVIDAIVEEADPAKLLTQYQSLASATKNMITTDVPEDVFPAMIELVVTVQGGTLESLTLDDEFFAEMGTTSASPDYDALHSRIDEILAPSDGAGSDGGDTSQAATQGGDDSNTGSSTRAEGSAESDTSNDDADASGAGDVSSAAGATSDTGNAEGEREADEPVESETVC